MVITGAQCPKAPNCSLPGRYIGNLVGVATPEGPGQPFDVRAELRDPYHLDFRPCPNSRVAQMGVGAYPLWSALDETYWIPGRREQHVATTPIPVGGSTAVYLNTELMFLPAKHATSHFVYFSQAGHEMQLLVTLAGSEANIARPSLLEATTQYVWRVDTHSDTGIYTGTTWSFTTGTNVSCQIVPHPPKPPQPRPSGCTAAENTYCPGLAHRGSASGNPCYDCVVRNSAELAQAGCWSNGGSGGRHAFIQKFCGPSA
eukprot:m.475870 g.475870  ORF g.475870 m.475870 type:complete len:258 (+) comp39279_c0_seq1:1812-2585(+)